MNTLVLPSDVVFEGQDVIIGHVLLWNGCCNIKSVSFHFVIFTLNILMLRDSLLTVDKKIWENASKSCQ